MNRSATGAVAAGFAVATPEWFDAVNGHLGRRAARGPDEPLFADLAGVEDLEEALATGLRSDARHITVNVLLDDVPAGAAEVLHVVFSSGRFRVGPGVLRHCDAVVRMGVDVARDAFQQGTDSLLINAVRDGRVAAAGSWDAVNFLRVHLVPEEDLGLRGVTA